MKKFGAKKSSRKSCVLFVSNRGNISEIEFDKLPDLINIILKEKRYLWGPEQSCIIRII
jgi:hypothetical protein